ncbi:hypothetical protein FGG08_003700 [Glutinoglossum americanum]|uniref:Vint domain-containing protein n=1 Tax=Glutinoglossum americanum TaxID=1670608 RepID=A0A9P8I909_9PEZI|nr:hypothetical protein FGG08_003700 [Glutinoglossum americanum]
MGILSHCRVSMANGSLKPISSLTKGDSILCCPTPPGGTPVTAEVSCILVTLWGGYLMVRATGTELECEERHPVKNPTTGEWIGAGRIQPIPKWFHSAGPLYGVLLIRDAPLYTIVVEGVVVAALGCNTREGLRHGERESGYISHPFYNTYRDVEREMKEVHPVGFERGRVVVTGIRRSGDDDGRTESFTREERALPDWAKE